MHTWLFTAVGKLNAPIQEQTASIGRNAQELRLFIRDNLSKVRFLVDSGSTVTLLPRSQVKRPLTRQPLTLYAANYAVIPTFGSERITVALGLRREFPWNAIIADVPHAILGADFLHHNGLLIDLQGHRLIDGCTGLASEVSLGPATTHTVATIAPVGPKDGPLAARYNTLLEEFQDLFEPNTAPVRAPNLPVKHTITTTGPPVYERPRRLAGDRLAAAKKAFEDLLERGIIQPSSSQWASPLHLVPKADGSWRVTGDYRRLNAITIPDRYPLPIIEDLLQESPGNIFSTIDLQKAFYQIPIAKDDVEKTAVTTPFGLFEFLGTSLGLRNAAQSMQRTIDHVLRKLPFVKAYVDDIFIASKDHEEHLSHLRQLFEALRNANLKINAAKCILGSPQAIYLGYLVTKDGFQPPPAKIDAIRRFPRPTTTTELRRFLGVANFYRRCMPGAANLQAPLNSLLKGLGKKARLTWTPSAEHAFEACKQSIASAACTTFFNSKAKLALRTDASDVAMGAVLEQQNKNGSWSPLGFYSQKLTSTQARYSPYDRELLAIYSAIKYFERMLEGRTFTVFTDHKPLIFAKDQLSHRASPRQARQLEFILRHNATFQHTAGKDNVVADALSRALYTPETPSALPATCNATPEALYTSETPPTSASNSRHDAELTVATAATLSGAPYTLETPPTPQANGSTATPTSVTNSHHETTDVNTVGMPTSLNASAIAQAQSVDAQLLDLIDNSCLNLQKLEIDGKQVYCDIAHGTVRPYLPTSLRRKAFDVIHGLSHPGGKATAKALTQKFIWPGARKDALNWAKQCEPCQASKVHRHNRAALGRFNNRFEHLHVDLVMMKPVRGMRYCLTIIDRFSRWPMAVPVPDQQATTVARALIENWISMFGTPLFITSDRGAQFESEIFAELAKLLGIALLRTTSYHPQSNGMVERFHRSLKAALRCCSQARLDCLPIVLLGLRSAFKEDLNASPAEMLFGTTLRLPGEFFVSNTQVPDHSSFTKSLKELFRAIRPVQASRHHAFHPFCFRDLATCSHVFKRVDSIRRPLDPPYTGPHRVIRRTDQRTFIVDVNGSERVISVDQLKPAYLEACDPQVESPQPPASTQPTSALAASPGPVDQEPPTPPASTITDAPSVSQRTQSKVVTFPSPPAQFTGWGVDVAAPPQPPSARRPRKQILAPRAIF